MVMCLGKVLPTMLREALEEVVSQLGSNHPNPASDCAPPTQRSMPTTDRAGRTESATPPEMLREALMEVLELSA
jgi:hypothetical protein